MNSTFFAMFAISSIASAAPNPIRPMPETKVPESAIQAVKAAVPMGWSVEVKGDTLTVRRNDEVKYLNPIGAAPDFGGPPPTPTGTWAYEIRLRFRPKMSEEEYADLKRYNDDLTVKFEAMRKGLRGITHKFDDYLPDTPEEKKLVYEYRAEQKKTPYHSLPNYCSDTHALEISDNVHITVSMTDKDEAAHCSATMKAICALFKPFPAKKAGDK